MSSSSSSSALVVFSRPCPRNECYDVFLSFRGIDTRRGFTNNLYRSLRENKVYTFMDEKLMGEEIENLFEIVEKSRMAVVVYSERFASSAWCLRELEKIMQRKKEKKMLMTPIFYKVDVDELKHLKGKTAECLDQHIPKHDDTTVNKWKDAVTNFGKVSGLSYKDNDSRYESDFITDVIARIKEKLEECKTLESSSIKPNSNNIRPRVDIMERPTVKLMGYAEQGDSVNSIDSHPIKPWVLLCLSGGNVSIWNFQTRMEEKSFSYSSGFPSGGSAKFIPEKHWIVVVGAVGGFLRVFDYNTLEKIKEFKPNNYEKYPNFKCVAVHPTLPYVLTTSTDGLIKLWNWENDWARIKTFKGHSYEVTHAAFNTKDSSSFSSVSPDETIKIWSFDSSAAKFTINPPNKEGVGSVEYFLGKDDKLYLLCISRHSCSAKIWDYESRTLVQTLDGHNRNVTATLAHPELPIIITGSLDKTIRIWNKNTYRLQLVWKSTLGSIYSIGFIEGSGEVALGCERGLLMIKIVDDETPAD